MHKIKKTIVQFFALLIRNKQKRKNFRAFWMETTIFDFFYCAKFLFSKIRDNSVLVLEANKCHGEVVPGYVKYFLDLGYNVDTILNICVSKEKPFSRFNDDKINHYQMSFSLFKLLLKTKKIKQYKHIFVTSLHVYTRSCSITEGSPDLLSLPLILVTHDINDITSAEDKKLLDNNKITMLGKFDNTAFINPHYFGDIKHTKKSDITTFIAVGGIVPFRKNHTLLIQAMEDLHKTNAEFKIVVVGSGSVDDIPQHLKKYIEIKGRLDFPKMYAELEKADYFLTLLDPENKEHERYITTGVTGSTQLIYGFNKIAITPQKFADFYGFNNDNAITYKTNADLSQAMSQAIALSKEDYEIKATKLNDLANKIYKESLKNLKDVVDA